ncbi:hypothetical protein JX266_012180 [Neoarthrinium moseri]|nr:hypothetical protein JX266_012180 [Neoarthrinium moseri]
MALRQITIAFLLAQRATSRLIPRDLVIPTSLPNNWTYVGCYVDNLDGRALALDGYNNATSMTAESCILYCMDRGYPFAGTEYSSECYCGDKVDEAATKAADTECSMACSGDATQPCGAGNRLSVFTGQVSEPVPPAPIAGWAYEGCYSDEPGRTLTFGAQVPGGAAAMTNDLCTAACASAGYPLAGTEYSGECYCGQVYSNGGAQVQKGCNMVCNGNSTQICGGSNRLSVWSRIGSGSNPTSTISTTAVPSPTGSGSPAAIPAPWSYKGCYSEGTSGRAFLNQQPDSQTLTIESCVNACIGLGYGVAGMEYAQQCFCDNFLRNGAALVGDSDCSMACTGDASQKCGAGNRLSVYSNDTLVIYQPPKPQTTDLPGSWEYVGCILDDIESRSLPWMSIDIENMTAASCIAGCSEFGYEAGGIEYGYQCFCGDIADVVNKGRDVLRPETECNVACPGDPTHLCGGGNRLTYYNWKGETLTTWSYAQGAAAGSYDFIMSAPIIPLISTVGINEKVVFVEKHGTSKENNSTGSFEFDPSLAPDYGTAFRELQLKTDVFCSASLVMPDKAGRQINIGGWAGEDLHGVRLYTPDAPLGTQGSTQWEEDVNALRLMDPRWYPTACTLSNGSIFIIGGEDGSDGPMVPTAEVLPKPAGVTQSTYLSYLNQTTIKVNSYPFAAVLPSGNMFFAQYNEARVISQVDFSTVKVLPRMPGAVNNPDSGRNYPLQGTLSLLPQHAPYTDPLGVLICGGTTDGANFALDNCISTQPDVAGADWVIERMPSTRVVSCMVGLPDGRYLIMNGAYNGRAGFGLAPNGNRGAVLYDPTKPVGARMTQLANSTISRLYHSEAVLMNDGRVLVSGSDPEDNVNPQEHRLEYFSPDYILSGASKPTFTINNKDWAYGQTVSFTLTSAVSGNIRVSLIGAVGSTHGNSMGQRTLFPAVSCTGTSCTVTAPPNARVSPPGWFQMFVLDGPTPSHAVWVRVGGDPAGIGNWPDLPGFTHPGV